MAHKQDERSFLQRWLPHPILAAALVVLWMLLLNDFSIGGLLVGCVLAILISILTSQFWPDRPHIRSYTKALQFLAIVAWDVIVANVIVARLILFTPVDKLETRWVTVPIELKTPEAIALLAGTITMTPGTVSSDLSADGRSLLVHCLDAPDVEVAVREMKARYEARLMEIFG
jgi:multicomponent K+:H+ antiporter subunit E